MFSFRSAILAMESTARCSRIFSNASFEPIRHALRGRVPALACRSRRPSRKHTDPAFKWKAHPGSGSLFHVLLKVSSGRLQGENSGTAGPTIQVQETAVVQIAEDKITAGPSPATCSRAQRKIAEMLALGDIRIGGGRSWDLEVHNPKFYESTRSRQHRRRRGVYGWLVGCAGAR